MEFYTKVCIEVNGKPENLQILIELHRACVEAQRNISTPPTELVRKVFPEWTGEEDYINPESADVFAPDVVTPCINIEDAAGYVDIDYVARLLQGWLIMIDSNSVIAFEYSHDASRSVPNGFGGGVVSVSRDLIQMVDTSEIMNAMREGRYLTLDQGDTVIAKEHLGMVGPGIVWMQEHSGWTAYIDRPDACVPLYSTGTREMFGDDDQANAAKAYETWLAKTTTEYWDCECFGNYIHPKSESSCPICGTTAEDQPDSIIREVLKAGLQISDTDRPLM